MIGNEILRNKHGESFSDSLMMSRWASGQFFVDFGSTIWGIVRSSMGSEVFISRNSRPWLVCAPVRKRPGRPPIPNNTRKSCGDSEPNS